MNFFWMMLFATNPVFLLFGLSGFLGKEAEKAASDISVMYGILFCLALIVGSVVGLGYLVNYLFFTGAV